MEMGRDFLASLAGAGLASLPGCANSGKPPLPPGDLIGPALIVGGGIGGLSAGWNLAKSGFKDFLLVELEAAPGGNSRSGRNEVGAYPQAAKPRYD